jgi:hypothetical protein
MQNAYLIRQWTPAPLHLHLRKFLKVQYVTVLTRIFVSPIPFWYVSFCKYALVSQATNVRIVVSHGVANRQLVLNISMPTYNVIGYKTYMSRGWRYKPEGLEFDFRWSPLGFFIDLSFRPHYDTWVNLTSKRNEYQKYTLESIGGRCVWLTLPPSCADFLGTLGASTSWSPKGLSRPLLG